jgi:NAD(P)-dependent dehydrogenase (short-subunit alcohol dehydrogenase family)
MRVMVVGATGTIGSEVVAALRGRHDVVEVAYRGGAEQVDLADPASIQALYRRVGQLDAVLSCAGQAAFKPLTELSDADFELSLRNKLMGQVNLVRHGLDNVRDGGSFTLTSGSLARHPEPGSPAVSLVNAGLEGFVGAAALEMPRGIRINVVSPSWVSETLQAMGRDPKTGTPAATVAQAYVRSLQGQQTGAVIEVAGG